MTMEKKENLAQQKENKTNGQQNYNKAKKFRDRK